MTSSAHIVVIGAGAFGGWTALHLQRAGAQVTLVDCWGPGNSRSSSGGETRVIRHTYANRIHVEMAASSLAQWKLFQDGQGKTLLFESGALFMIRDPEFESAARKQLESAAIDFEIFAEADAKRRFPDLSAENGGTLLFEPGAGYLMAREACSEVADAFVASGGELRISKALPGHCASNQMRQMIVEGQANLGADAFVFACGPWLPELFPRLLGEKIAVSRQEVFFFGVPAGRNLDLSMMPVWADIGGEFWYGIPDVSRRGLKIANDTKGPPIDPTSDDRLASAAGAAAARERLALRVPAMSGAPLIESRVCQYSNTRDDFFVIDRHPEVDNVWIVGGGSGHGFKHGPAVGEIVTGCVLGQREPPPEFLLSRF